jgi:hypothetical protein
MSELSITEIALKYNCDKYDLGYLKHYEKKFESIRNDVTKILEIGLNTERFTFNVVRVFSKCYGLCH